MIYYEYEQRIEKSIPTRTGAITMTSSNSALDRAHAEGITFKQETATTWAVTNPKYTEGHYTVRQSVSGSLICNCQAGAFGRLCKHVALVQEAPAPLAVRMTDAGWREAYAQIALLAC